MQSITIKVSSALLYIITTLSLINPVIAKNKIFNSLDTVSNIQENISLLNQSNKKKRINESKLSIGGLTLGMTTADVKKILGKPKQGNTSWSDCFGDYATTLKFNKLELVMNGDSLSSIVTSNSAYVTESGIHVGDSINKLEKAYGRFRSSRSYGYIVYANDNFGGISFKIHNGVIIEISWIIADC